MGFLSPHNSPVFRPDGTHRTLLADVGRYAAVAGIKKDWIWQPLGGHASEKEVRWVAQFRSRAESGSCGILYNGPPPGPRLDAICGAFLRNFVDARVRTTHAAIMDDESARCSVLILPDFCLTDDPANQFIRAGVTRILFERFREGKQTICYTISKAAVRTAYGDAVADHVKTNMLGDPR